MSKNGRRLYLSRCDECASVCDMFVHRMCDNPPRQSASHLRGFPARKQSSYDAKRSSEQGKAKTTRRCWCWKACSFEIGKNRTCSEKVGTLDLRCGPETHFTFFTRPPSLGAIALQTRPNRPPILVAVSSTRSGLKASSTATKCFTVCSSRVEENLGLDSSA